MSVAGIEDVMSHNPRFIRKGLRGSIFVKLWEEGDNEILQVYTEAGGLVIPAGYEDVGLVTAAQAADWARDVQTNDTESWGYTEPTRRDITNDVVTVSFTMQESKRRVLELYNSADYSQVTPDSDGNVVLDKPMIPETLHWRVFQLSKDGDGPDAIYFLDALPRAQVTQVGGRQVGANQEIQYPVTLTGYRDPAWGTSFRQIWGGPGYDPSDYGFGA